MESCIKGFVKLGSVKLEGWTAEIGLGITDSGTKVEGAGAEAGLGTGVGAGVLRSRAEECINVSEYNNLAQQSVTFPWQHRTA